MQNPQQSSPPIHHTPPIIGIGGDIGMALTGMAAAYQSIADGECLEIIYQLQQKSAIKYPSLVFFRFGTLENPEVGQNAWTASIRGESGKLFSLLKRNLAVDLHDHSLGVDVTPIAFTTALVRDMKLSIQAFLKQKGWQGDHAKKRYAFAHPGTWGPRELKAFNTVLEAAGFSDYLLIAEPLATALAAAYYTTDPSVFLPGSRIFICDLGGGTLDLAIVAVENDGSVVVKSAAGGDPLIGMSNLDRIIGMLLYQKTNQGLTPKMQNIVNGHLVGGAKVTAAWNEMPLSDAAKSDLLSFDDIFDDVVDEVISARFTLRFGARIPLHDHLGSLF